MNIKTKNEAVGKFEQALVDMLNKVYGDSKNVKIDSAPVSGGTMYIVGDSWNEVDFLVLKDETGKDMNYPALTIYINGEETKKHHGKNGMTLKTFYGLHDADTDMLRTCQQILQKYIDGVNLDLSWIRFEESNNSEADADAEQAFKDMADSLGISDRSIITKDGNSVKFVLKLKIKDLEDYAWEYNPELKVIKNIASPTADALDGARKSVNTIEDAVAWLKGDIEAILDTEKEAFDMLGDEYKKSEADYSSSRVSKSIADAYKLLDDYFCDNNGNLRTDAINKMYTTFRNESDLTARSKSKATKSHSLAWETLIREINATLEWDDETPHATKLTSEQVKNWFKLKGRDFKEDLKPLVDAIDAYRNKKESKGESMKNEANIEDLKGMVVSDGTMGVNVLIRKYLDVLETYAPDNYKAYIEANPELKDRNVWMALDVQDKSYIVDELADELDKIAPEGYYFGASEGDGACFGFWSVDPDESKKREACKGGKDDDKKDGKDAESKKSEDTYDRPVTLYATTRYDDAEEAQKFLDSISGGEVKVSKERNGDTLYVSIEGADEAIDTFLAVYKDNYDTLEKDCDADVNGWTDPVDLKYYTVQGRKELTGESHKKPEESSKPVKNILRRRFEVLTKSVLHACDKLVKDASLAGEFDDEVIYAEDTVKNAIESFNAMGDAIVRLKTVLESHKNEDNMEIIGILSDAITKIVADEQGDETDAATAGADSVIDQVEREYGNEPENEPEANGEENEAPSPAGAEAPNEF